VEETLISERSRYSSRFYPNIAKFLQMLERDAGVEFLAGKETAVAVIATPFRPFRLQRSVNLIKNWGLV
jgi:hypothetical protein